MHLHILDHLKQYPLRSMFHLAVGIRVGHLNPPNKYLKVAISTKFVMDLLGLLLDRSPARLLCGPHIFGCCQFSILDKPFDIRLQTKCLAEFDAILDSKSQKRKFLPNLESMTKISYFKNNVFKPRTNHNRLRSDQIETFGW